MTSTPSGSKAAPIKSEAEEGCGVLDPQTGPALVAQLQTVPPTNCVPGTTGQLQDGSLPSKLQVSQGQEQHMGITQLSPSVFVRPDMAAPCDAAAGTVQTNPNAEGQPELPAGSQPNATDAERLSLPPGSLPPALRPLAPSMHALDGTAEAALHSILTCTALEDALPQVKGATQDFHHAQRLCSAQWRTSFMCGAKSFCDLPMHHHTGWRTECWPCA